MHSYMFLFLTSCALRLWKCIPEGLSDPGSLYPCSIYRIPTFPLLPYSRTRLNPTPSLSPCPPIVLTEYLPVSPSLFFNGTGDQYLPYSSSHVLQRIALTESFLLLILHAENLTSCYCVPPAEVPYDGSAE